MPLSAAKRQGLQQQQMMMNPLMMMLPQMAQMAMQPAVEEEEEEEVKDRCQEVEKPEERRALPERGQMSVSGVQDKLSTSLTFLRQIPRCRLSEGLEWLCKDLDPSMTHALSNTGLLALVYMCVQTYTDLFNCWVRAMNRDNSWMKAKKNKRTLAEVSTGNGDVGQMLGVVTPQASPAQPPELVQAPEPDSLIGHLSVVVVVGHL
eukprot:s48_g26.t1